MSVRRRSLVLLTPDEALFGDLILYDILSVMPPDYSPYTVYTIGREKVGLKLRPARSYE
jgi:hypothetical protein